MTQKQLSLIPAKSNRSIANRETSTREFIDAAVPDNTRQAYGRQWRAFRQYCTGRKRADLPAEIETVADYVQHLANKGLKVASIEQALAAITWMHTNAHHDNPRNDPRVKLVMKGIRNKIGVRPKRKSPILMAQLLDAIETEGHDLRGLRNRALILCGWTGAMRSSELVMIDVSSIAYVGDGATVLIEKSKTDQEGAGMLKQLPAIDDPRLNATMAIRKWLTAAKITDGPVFRAILGNDKVRDGYMTTREVRRIIKAACIRTGLGADAFSGHSLRAGFVTQAALNGVPLWQIAEQTGHKPGSAVLQDYIRSAGQGARSAVVGAFGLKPKG
jgi:site-specific recombinase XerD